MTLTKRKLAEIRNYCQRVDELLDEAVAEGLSLAEATERFGEANEQGYMLYCAYQRLMRQSKDRKQRDWYNNEAKISDFVDTPQSAIENKDTA